MPVDNCAAQVRYFVVTQVLFPMLDAASLSFLLCSCFIDVKNQTSSLLLLNVSGAVLYLPCCQFVVHHLVALFLCQF